MTSERLARMTSSAGGRRLDPPGVDPATARRPGRRRARRRPRVGGAQDPARPADRSGAQPQRAGRQAGRQERPRRRRRPPPRPVRGGRAGRRRGVRPVVGRQPPARGKGLARRALAQELRRKGIDDEVARRRSTRSTRTTRRRRRGRWSARSCASLQPGSTETTATRRLVGMLARKGYPPGLAFAVVRDELAPTVRVADESESARRASVGPWRSRAAPRASRRPQAPASRSSASDIPPVSTADAREARVRGPSPRPRRCPRSTSARSPSTFSSARSQQVRVPAWTRRPASPTTQACSVSPALDQGQQRSVMPRLAGAGHHHVAGRACAAPRAAPNAPSVAVTCGQQSPRSASSCIARTSSPTADSADRPATSVDQTVATHADRPVDPRSRDVHRRRARKADRHATTCW